MPRFANSFLQERIAYGEYGDITPVLIQGANAATTTSGETVWDESIAYAFLAANMSSPTISSANANDTSAGTGARTVKVTGVDASFNVTTATLTMNGQTGVAVGVSMMTVNSIEVITAGSGGVNAGLIYVGTGTVTTGKPAVVHGIVAAGLNMSTSFIYCVPAGYTLLMQTLTAANRNTTAHGNELGIDAIVNLGLKKRMYTDGFVSTTARANNVLMPPLRFAEKTQLTATVLSSAASGPCYATANCLLINNAIFNAG